MIMVFDSDMEQMLMCKRRKNPCLGFSNLVGGKIEPGESGLDAAYRELFEETAIPRQAIELHPIMDMTYHMAPTYIEVYAGRLTKEVAVSGEENELYWCDINTNFFDMTLFAGEGNIGHMLEQAKLSRHLFFPEGSQVSGT
jgi:8-oxo-dGTP diphosphatase